MLCSTADPAAPHLASMSSFNKPFRGLPAEIRLIIWEYVIMPTIKVTEISRTPGEHPMTKHYSTSDSDCDRQSTSRLIFDPSLRHLAAVVTVNRAVHQEFTALLCKIGLSLKTQSASFELFYELIEQFKGLRAPGIKLLEIHRDSRTQTPRNTSLGSVNSCPTTACHNLTSAIPVEQVELRIDGRQLEAAVEESFYIGSNRAINTSHFKEPAGMRPLYKMASQILIGRNIPGARDLITKRLARRVVFNIFDVDEHQKLGLLDALSGYEPWLRSCGVCVTISDTSLPDGTGSHEPSGPIAYRYQIKFERKPGST